MKAPASLLWHHIQQPLTPAHCRPLSLLRLEAEGRALRQRLAAAEAAAGDVERLKDANLEAWQAKVCFLLTVCGTLFFASEPMLVCLLVYRHRRMVATSACFPTHTRANRKHMHTQQTHGDSMILRAAWPRPAPSWRAWRARGTAWHRCAQVFTFCHA